MALEERERLLEEMTMEKQRLMQAFTVMLSKEVYLHSHLIFLHVFCFFSLTDKVILLT